jgi:hypothetical protein
MARAPTAIRARRPELERRLALRPSVECRLWRHGVKLIVRSGESIDVFLPATWADGNGRRSSFPAMTPSDSSSRAREHRSGAAAEWREPERPVTGAPEGIRTPNLLIRS